MSTSGPPFVNRDEELSTLEESLSSGEGTFFVLRGPSGSGKTALIDQFQDHCEGDDVVVVRHDIGQPETKNVFLYRFLETWDEALPSTRLGEIKERIAETDTGSLAGAAGMADPTLGIAAHFFDSVLSIAFDDSSLSGATDETEFVLNLLQEESDRSIVVLIDQFDSRRLPDQVVDALDRVFSELSEEIPDRHLWCIGSDHDVNRGSPAIEDLRVDTLDSDAVEEFIDACGLGIGEAASAEDIDLVELTNIGGPDLTKRGLIDEMMMRTKGHPFLLSLFLETTEEEDISRAIEELPMGQSEAREHLEQRILDRLDSDQEEFLRDTCVLERLNVDIAAHLADSTVSDTRQTLRSLSRLSIVRPIQGDVDHSQYRCHDLIRFHLQRNVRRQRERTARVNAIAAFSQRIFDELLDQEQGIEGGSSTIDIDYYSSRIRAHFKEVSDRESIDRILELLYNRCDDMQHISSDDVEQSLLIQFGCRDDPNELADSIRTTIEEREEE